MCKLCVVVVVVMVLVAGLALGVLAVEVAAVVITVAQILVDSFCATINTSIGLSLLKGISDSLYRCFS